MPFAVGTARRRGAAEAETFVPGVADRHPAPRSRQLKQRHQFSMRRCECDDTGTEGGRVWQGRGPPPCKRAAGARKCSRGAAGLGRGRAAGEAEPVDLADDRVAAPPAQAARDGGGAQALEPERCQQDDAMFGPAQALRPDRSFREGGDGTRRRRRREIVGGCRHDAGPRSGMAREIGPSLESEDPIAAGGVGSGRQAAAGSRVCTGHFARMAVRTSGLSVGTKTRGV